MELATALAYQTPMFGHVEVITLKDGTESLDFKKFQLKLKTNFIFEKMSEGLKVIKTEELYM